MTESQRRTAYELFYLVKGHLKPFTDRELELITEEYSRRLWWNEEAHLYSQGFEQSYAEFSAIDRSH